MAFAVLEDYKGEIELTFFSTAWEKCQSKIEAGKVAILKGKIDYQADRDKYSFNVDECLETGDMERAAREEDAQERKWDKFRNVLKYAKDLDLRVLDLGSAAKAESGNYTVIGILKSIRTRPDKNGKEMAFGTLADYRGEIDLVFFARIWENWKALISVDEVLAFKGSIDPANDKNPLKPGFIVSSLQDLNKLVRAAAKKAAEAESAEPPSDTPPEASTDNNTPLRQEIHIRLKAGAANNEADLYFLRDCLEKNPGPFPVYIHVPAASSKDGTSKDIIIRSSDQITTSIQVSIDALSDCNIVAEVWCAK